MTRTSTRLLAAGGALVLTALAATPASAVAVLSRADANAVTVSIAGNGQGSGTAGATYDGQETRTGETEPPISLLSGQDLLNAGVLTQQATAGVGFSAACAGVAGTSGSVAQIGDGNCLRGGDVVGGSLTGLDLSSVLVADPASALAPLNELATPVRDALVPVLNTALAQARAEFGDPALLARLRTVEGRCAVQDGTPSGSATLADAGISLRAGGQNFSILTLPVEPAPNSRVATDFSEVLEAFLTAVDAQLTLGLAGGAAPLTQVTEQIRDQIVERIRTDVQGNLTPLEDNLLRITLNEQSRPTTDSIRVTAMHVEVIPAAAPELGASAIDVRIGNANCGPADRAPAEAAAPAAPEKAVPKLPTAVSAGVESTPDTSLTARFAEAAPLSALALTGLLLALAGVRGLRRHEG